MRILLATHNPGKLLEIRSLLRDLELEIILPASDLLSLKVEEDGQTYHENAALKARAFANASGFLALADDSGLEVEALGGLPGLVSARFSPKAHASDEDRRAYLLQRLDGLPQPWTARFRCVVALASPDQQIWFAEGVCDGEIIPEERGQNGFGYDPIFWLPARGKTMAELTLEEKNQISHRAKAIQAIRPILLDLLSKGRPGRSK